MPILNILVCEHCGYEDHKCKYISKTTEEGTAWIDDTDPKSIDTNTFTSEVDEITYYCNQCDKPLDL